MHPMTHQIQYEQRSAELRREAELQRRIKSLPRQRKAPKGGKKVATAITGLRTKRA